MAPDQSLLSIPEASQRLGVSPATGRRWVKAGTLPAIKLPGGRAKVRAAVVDAILAGEQPEAAAS